MGRPCKCKLCKKSLSTNDAYCIVINGKKSYYCSAVEYEAEQTRKEKAAADKEKAYRLICDIIGRKEIIHGILWKEWAIWNKVADNEKIWKYLEENKDYLCGVISKLEDIEFNRIRYLSAILKSRLGDYKPKVSVTQKTMQTIMDEHYETKFKKKTRVSLEDFEEDFYE